MGTRLYASYLLTKNRMQKHMKDFLTEEQGETNIIAIILIILVVIALVAIFRTQLTNIVTGLFGQVKSALGLGP